MPAILKIDQAGLNLGTAGKTRTDGLLNGALVTLTSTGAGAAHSLVILWIPDGDTNAAVTFTPLTATTWSFTPSVDAPGTFRFQLGVDGELTFRDLKIRTALLKLTMPGLNEPADLTANLLAMGADKVLASEDNELETSMPPALSGLPQTQTPSPFVAGNFGGWYRWGRDMTIQLEDRAAGLEPQGFVTNDGLQSPIADKSLLEFAAGNLTLDPKSPFLFYDVFIQGRRVRKETQQTVVIPSTSGEHWVHFDPTATGIPLAVTSDPDAGDTAEIMRSKTPVTVLVQDFDVTPKVVLMVDKRHDLGMGPSTKVFIQAVAGARFVEGVLPQNFVLGDGGLDSHAQFAIGDGFAISLDILFPISDDFPIPDPQTLSPILNLARWLYRTGTGQWRRASGNATFPINALGATPGHNGNGTSLVVVPDGEFCLATYFAVKSVPGQDGVASNREGDRIIAIAGQEVFTDLADAQAAAERVLGDLDTDGLPADIAPICTVIIEANSSFLNAAGSRIRPTDDGNPFIDHRALLGDEAGISGPGGGAGTFRNETSGVFEGGLPSAGAGLDEITITDGSGQAQDYSSPTAITAPQAFGWTNITDEALSAIATTQETYLFISTGGGLIQVTQPAESDYRNKAHLGVALHGDNTTVEKFIATPRLGYGASQSNSQYLREFVGTPGWRGLEIAPIVSTLTFTRAAGRLWGEGNNFHVAPDDASRITLAASGGAQTFARIFGDNAENGETNFDTLLTNTLVDPTNFENAGVKELVGGSDEQATLPRLYRLPDGTELLALGQEKFADFTTAVTNAGRESFRESALMRYARLVGRWAVRRINTDLADPTEALFIPVDGGGGAGGDGGGTLILGALSSHQLFAAQLDTPSNSDWAINAKASLLADPANAGFDALFFDSAVEEGTGWTLAIPATSTDMSLTYEARARTTPGGAGQIAKWNLRFRTIGGGVAVSTWSAPIQLTDTVFGADQFFQKITDSRTLASWGLTAGLAYQFELTRDATDGGDTLNGIDAGLFYIWPRL